MTIIDDDSVDSVVIDLDELPPVALDLPGGEASSSAMPSRTQPALHAASGFVFSLPPIPPQVTILMDVILAAATMGGMGALLALQEQIAKGTDLGAHLQSRWGSGPTCESMPSYMAKAEDQKILASKLEWESLGPYPGMFKLLTC